MKKKKKAEKDISSRHSRLAEKFAAYKRKNNDSSGKAPVLASSRSKLSSLAERFAAYKRKNNDSSGKAPVTASSRSKLSPPAEKFAAEKKDLSDKEILSDLRKKISIPKDKVKTTIDDSSLRKHPEDKDREKEIIKKLDALKEKELADQQGGSSEKQAKKANAGAVRSLFSGYKNRKLDRFEKELKKTPEKAQHKTRRYGSKKTVKKKSASERKRWLAEHIQKAGLDIEPTIVNLTIMRISLVVAGISFLYLLITSFIYYDLLWKKIIKVLFGPPVFFALCMIILNLSFRVYIDLKKFQRRLMVEDVLADFFQLASANIRAGMSTDKALWFAVRPRFGVLAKEIELVAKRTLSGGDLQDSLLEFAKKYDSKLVLRSIYLLNEGIKAGGNVGDLLNKIAANIQEMKTLKREMSASVTTYVIFITFASIVAGPCLFGLSGELLNIVQGISGQMAGSTESANMNSGFGMMVSLSSDSLNAGDYKKFVLVCLAISSFFSAIIVSVIRYGNVKQGMHYIPIFAVVSYILYFIAAWVMGKMLGGIVIG